MTQNPFRTGDEDSLKVRPCVVVIFGVTGDLARRKLVPALYNLAVDGLLPANFHLFGFARRSLLDEDFRLGLRESVAEHSRRRPLNEDLWQDFALHSYYIESPFDSAEGYRQLKARIEEIDRQLGTSCTRLFYCATSPEYFEVVSEQLAEAHLLSDEDVSSDPPLQARVVIEKPFGRDVSSAQRLNRELTRFMREEQIFRIDHYLGKETVQNLLVFRFANGIFEPIWNHKYVDHVEISVCEDVGVGTRAGYFDKAGILRDIVQNHVLQLLCLVALEPPVTFAADAVRDEKVKVLRSVRRIPREEVGQRVVRARYETGFVGGEEVGGYLSEKGVSETSSTETFVALELLIDNWRWAGVPFYLRAGKRLPKRVTEISVHFRQVPYSLFRKEDVASIMPNILSFQIQPDEGVSIRICSKPPGPKVRVQTVSMDFSYGTSFGVETPEAYERLLLDAMRGDATLFTRADEIEEAWGVLEPILQSWRSEQSIPVFGYEAGSWGPEAAEQLLQMKGFYGWRRL